MCVCLYRDVERVDLHVRGAVDWSLGFEAGDVEQRAILVLVRPEHLQRRLTERTGPVVLQLRAGRIITHYTEQTLLSFIAPSLHNTSD